MNTIESILNDIDELLEDSWSLPLSGGRCVVDAEKVRDLIDSIRMNMPAEIKQARAVVADRNQILSLAKGEAEALIRKAEERAKQLLEQESIVRQANAKAMALLNDASTRAQQLVEDAQKQAEQTVNDAEAKATAIRTEASTRSREMKQASYEFAENILRTSQEVVAKSLGNITTTRQALAARPSVSASTLADEYPNDFARIIGLHTYSQSPRRCYDIQLTGKWATRGGFRFEEFTLTPRKEDAEDDRNE